MFPIRFPAVLKTESGQLLEEGIAYISHDDKSVYFLNDFVPLINLGEKVKIIRKEIGFETHSFIGEVFLSSKTLLQITSVNDMPLRDAERISSINTPISTKMLYCENGFITIPSKSEDPIHINIQSLSIKGALIASPIPLTLGQNFLISLTKPFGIKYLAIMVLREIYINEGIHTYECEVLSRQEECLQAIKTFIKKTSYTSHNVF